MNKKNICGIYKITSPTGKIYVGQAIDINESPEAIEKRVKAVKLTWEKKRQLLKN